MNNDELTESCKKIASIYPNDLCEKDLIEEFQIARDYFEFQSPIFSHSKMYSTIINDDLICLMPNIEILLRIYLCMFCSNVNDERSFSKLKYVKNYLRNSMGEEKLNAFALLSIEYDVMNDLNLDEIIDDFIYSKNRKRNISVTPSSSRASSVTRSIV